MAELLKQASFPPTPPAISPFDPRQEPFSPPRTRRHQRRRDDKIKASEQHSESILSAERSTFLAPKPTKITTPRPPLKERDTNSLQSNNVNSGFLESVDHVTESSKSSTKVEEPKTQRLEAPSTLSSKLAQTSKLVKKTGVRTNSKPLKDPGKVNAQARPAPEALRFSSCADSTAPQINKSKAELEKNLKVGAKSRKKSPTSLDRESSSIVADETKEETLEVKSAAKKVPKFRTSSPQQSKSAPLLETKEQNQDVSTASRAINTREVASEASGIRRREIILAALGESSSPTNSKNSGLPALKLPRRDVSSVQKAKLDTKTKEDDSRAVPQVAPEKATHFQEAEDTETALIDDEMPETYSAPFFEDRIMQEIPPSSPGRFAAFNRDKDLTSDNELEYVDPEVEEDTAVIQADMDAERVERSKMGGGGEQVEQEAIKSAPSKNSSETEEQIKPIEAQMPLHSTPTKKHSKHTGPLRHSENDALSSKQIKLKEQAFGIYSDSSDEEVEVIDIKKSKGTNLDARELKQEGINGVNIANGGTRPRPRPKPSVKFEQEVRREVESKTSIVCKSNNPGEADVGQDENAVMGTNLQDSAVFDDFGFGVAEQAAEELLREKEKRIVDEPRQVSPEKVMAKEGDVDSQTQTQGQFTVQDDFISIPSSLRLPGSSTHNPAYEEDEDTLPLVVFKNYSSKNGAAVEEPAAVDSTSELSDVSDFESGAGTSNKKMKAKAKRSKKAKGKGKSEDMVDKAPKDIKDILAVLDSEETPQIKKSEKTSKKGQKRKAAETEKGGVKGKGRKLDLDSQDMQTKTPKPIKSRVLEMEEEGSGPHIGIDRLKKTKGKEGAAMLELDEYSIPPGMTREDWEASSSKTTSSKRFTKKNGAKAAKGVGAASSKGKSRLPVPVAAEDEGEGKDEENPYLLPPNPPKQARKSLKAPAKEKTSASSKRKREESVVGSELQEEEEEDAETKRKKKEQEDHFKLIDSYNLPFEVEK